MKKLYKKLKKKVKNINHCYAGLKNLDEYQAKDEIMFFFLYYVQETKQLYCLHAKMYAKLKLYQNVSAELVLLLQDMDEFNAEIGLATYNLNYMLQKNMNFKNLKDGFTQYCSLVNDYYDTVVELLSYAFGLSLQEAA